MLIKCEVRSQDLRRAASRRYAWAQPSHAQALCGGFGGAPPHAHPDPALLPPVSGIRAASGLHCRTVCTWLGGTTLPLPLPLLQSLALSRPGLHSVPSAHAWGTMPPSLPSLLPPVSGIESPPLCCHRLRGQALSPCPSPLLHLWHLSRPGYIADVCHDLWVQPPSLPLSSSSLWHRAAQAMCRPSARSFSLSLSLSISGFSALATLPYRLHMTCGGTMPPSLSLPPPFSLWHLSRPRSMLPNRLQMAWRCNSPLPLPLPLLQSLAFEPPPGYIAGPSAHDLEVQALLPFPLSSLQSLAFEPPLATLPYCLHMAWR